MKSRLVIEIMKKLKVISKLITENQVCNYVVGRNTDEDFFLKSRYKN